MTSVFEEVLERLGVLWSRAHLISYATTQESGVVSRWEADLQPIGEREIGSGELVELHSFLDEQHTLSATSRVRFDILELDQLLTGGFDDPVVSLLGTNAFAPPSDFTTVQRTTVFRQLGPDETFADYVEQFKRDNPTDYEDSVLVAVEQDADANRQTHVLTWWRAQRVEDFVNAEFYFVLDVDASLEDTPAQVLDVRKSDAGVAVRIMSDPDPQQGRLLDANPAAATPEPLPGVEARLAGRRGLSGDDGKYVVDARLALGDHDLDFGRGGVDTVQARVRVTEDDAGLVTAVVTRNGTELGRATTASAPDDATLLQVQIASDVGLTVHKLRGTVVWPDSRRVDDADYVGTPLSGKRVFVLPLADGPTAAQRPRSSREWADLKRRPGVLRSSPRGVVTADGRTGVNGQFEVKYVDVSVGRRYLVWVESHDPDDPDPASDAPEYVVRTLRDHALLQMTGPNGGAVEDVRRQLIDHSFNLGDDFDGWGLDSIRVVDWEADPARPNPAATDLRVIRPARGVRGEYNRVPAGESVKPDFDRDPIGEGMVVDRLQLDAAKVVSGLLLQSLPLVPVFESADRQCDTARRARAALAQALDTPFPRGHFSDDLLFVLDFRRVASGIDFTAPAPAPAPAWDAAAAAGRRCELLEGTFFVSTQLGPGRPLGVAGARWRSDAVTLADLAQIQIPAGGAIGGRSLASTWVPVVRAPSPRVIGFAAERRVYLAPGHGLWPAAGAQASSARADWRSNRGGWSFAAPPAPPPPPVRAGEDENNAYMAAEVDRIVVRNRLTERADGAAARAVTPVREIRDLTRPGVFNRANDVFEVVTVNPADPAERRPDPTFLADRAQVVDGILLPEPEKRWIGSPNGLGNPAGGKNAHGIGARIDLAARLAALARPNRIDIYLAIHTNAGGPAARGTMAMFLDSETSTANAAEANTLGARYARLLADAIIARCNTRRLGGAGGGVFSMRTNQGDPIRELEETFDHWALEAPGVVQRDWRRVRDRPPAVPAGVDDFAIGGGQIWHHRGIGFPTDIPVAIAEIAFHSNRDDAALLTQAWFKRLAAEAMVFATETQLREDPSAVSRADVVRILRATFGETAAVGGLAANANPVDGDLANYVNAVTGAAVVAPAATLDDAVAAIEAGRATYTLGPFATALRDELSVRAGYAAGHADIAPNVEERILSGGRIAGLARAGLPLTRAEAARLVGEGIGITPADLRTLAVRQFNGQPLMPPLADGLRGDAFVTRPEATALLQRVRALQPWEIYRVERLYLADPQHRRLRAPGRENGASVYPETPVTIVAETRGAVWNVALTTIEFTIRNHDGYERRLRAAARSPTKLGSVTWPVELPRADSGFQPFYLRVAVNHPTHGRRLLKEERVEIELL